MSNGGFGGIHAKLLLARVGGDEFVAVLPGTATAASSTPAIDGCRHFMFVFPPIAVLAGLGLSASVGLLARWHRNAMIAGLAAIASPANRSSEPGTAAWMPKACIAGR